MQFWIIQTLNSIAFGGLLFLLSSGFSLAFGLMRIPNLAHGGFFMLGAYLGATITFHGGNFWIAVLEAALKSIDTKIEDKAALMKALRENKMEETCRGPVSFDKYGNVVGNVYIRRVEKKDGKLVNTMIKTYPNVSQFWTYKPEDFLKNPVYSRDFPPAKNLEP